jgi:hypothetical protein
MTVTGCPYFNVACIPAVNSCGLCVVRARALEREAKRERIEARRLALLGRTPGVDGSPGEDLLPGAAGCDPQRPLMIR